MAAQLGTEWGNGPQRRSKVRLVAGLLGACTDAVARVRREEGERAAFRRPLWRLVIVVVLLSAVVLPLPASGASRGTRERAGVAELRLGQAVFWAGPYVERSVVAPGGGPGRPAAACTAGGCWDYIVDVVDTGGRLRVALEHPDGWDVFGLELYDPAGGFVGQAFAGAPSKGALSAELFATDAAPGPWRVRVTATRVADSAFRMRAKLERAPARAASGSWDLLPNLRVTPPFEFTFAASPNATSAAFGPPLGRSEGPAVSCLPEETADFGVTRCLRFSVGPENVGAGPLELRFVPLDGMPDRGTLYQRIHATDGSYRDVAAGEYEYHKQHAHYHHSGFGRLELYRVGPDRSLRLAGTGPKQGFCMGAYWMPNWRSFDADPAGDMHSECNNPIDGHMGLSRGWADIYYHELYGNFVDFGANPDGRYVVRVTTDDSRQVAETDERDNAAYAYIEVIGDRVRVLQRGYGGDPWDPRRRVARDILPPTPQGSAIPLW
jgi:hypothetical protein